MVPGCSGPLSLCVCSVVDMHARPQQPRGAGGVTPDLHQGQEGWGDHPLEGLLSKKSSPFTFMFPLGLKPFSLGSKHGMFVKFMRAFREAFREYILSLLL